MEERSSGNIECLHRKASARNTLVANPNAEERRRIALWQTTRTGKEKRACPAVAMKTEVISAATEAEFAQGGVEYLKKAITESIYGKQTWFLIFDEVRAIWKMIDPLQVHLEKESTPLALYPSGGTGPAEADVWIEGEGAKWAN